MKNDNKFVSDKDIERLLLWQRSPELFVKDIWKLSAERDNKKFIKRKNISWQQHDILLAVEKALAGKASRKISVRSGNGIGKSSSAVFIILWYLFVFKNAQVACTAPSSSQLFDVLWKEANKWISEMPEAFKSKYEWNTTHIRMTENPFIWFARAATGRKESPEALAGLHGENVLLIADESSGIPDEIFEIAEGSLTEKNTLVLLISNPTRLTGYFYETFNKDKARWQNLHFSSLESPLVNAEEFAMSYEAKYGIDSDEYRVHVLGEFPNAESVDKAGYVSMFDEGDLTIVPDTGKFVNPRMGIDPSGEGSNETIWVVRDNFRAKVVAREAVSTTKSMALKTSTLMEHYKIPANRVLIDDFGIGCFDDKTEILTSNGFKFFRDLNAEEKVFSLDVLSDVPSFQTIQKIYKYKFDGFLNYFSSRSLNFAVTDNHKMLALDWRRKPILKEFNLLPKSHFGIKASNRSWPDGRNEEFFNLISAQKMPNGGEKRKEWNFNILDWASFLGWFVSEGCVYSRYEGGGDLHGRKWLIHHISISQKNFNKRTIIRSLLKKMNIGFKDDGQNFVITNFVLGEHLLKHCRKYAHNKRIPDYIKNSKPKVIRAFLDSFALGDGWQIKKGGKMYSTSSPSLADDIHECLAKLGIAGKMKLQNKAGSKFIIEGREVIRKFDTYMIYEKKFPEDHHVLGKRIKKIPYSGYIYCVETEPYNTILVRREGTIMWSGNSKLVQELSESGLGRVRGVNVGERAEDGERFINKRAENYMRLKNWLSEGGQLVRTEGWRQLLDIKYRRELSGRLKVKGKREMRAEGVDSPDVADALMLTFEGEKPISGQVADKKRSSEAIAEAVNIYGRH